MNNSTEYHEAGRTPGGSRAKGRSVGFSMFFHAALVFLIVAPSLFVSETAHNRKLTKKVNIIPDPPLKPPKAPQKPLPPNVAPHKLPTPNTTPKTNPEPDPPPKPAIDPGDVDPLSATLIYLDPDLHQLEAVLRARSGCIAFGPPPPKPEAIPYFTAKYCQPPDWLEQPLPGGRESAGAYFAIHLYGGQAFVDRLRVRSGQPSGNWAYAVFPKSIRTEVNLQIMDFAAALGIRVPTEVQVQYSGAAPSGFVVVHATEVSAPKAPAP